MTRKEKILIKNADQLKFSPILDQYSYIMVFDEELCDKTIHRNRELISSFFKEVNDRFLIRKICYYWNDNKEKELNMEDIDFNYLNELILSGELNENLIFKIRHNYSEYNR